MRLPLTTSSISVYLEGFAERSKIKTNLEIPSDFGRLSRDAETTIFRVVQECLTNIHRHSGSAVARALISRVNHDLLCGSARRRQRDIATSVGRWKCQGKAGVGIRGMRERIRQLGGSLEIGSQLVGSGTVIVARLPVGSPVKSPV